MHTAIKCDLSDHTFTTITNLDDIDAIQNEPDAVFWLNFENPHADELTRMGRVLDLHPLAIEDALNGHQRPKIEEYENFSFVIFYSVGYDKERNEVFINEIKLFIGDNYLVTVHDQPIRELDEAAKRWQRNSKDIEKGVVTLVYSLLDSIVDNYFPVVDALVEHADQLEDQIYDKRRKSHNFTFELLTVKKRLAQIRRVAVPERDILNVLTNRDSPIFSEASIIYFRDVYDHITRMTDTLDLYRDQISSTMDANLAVASNDLNIVMRTLTSASIILMVDSLIAGIYGMNFDNMPELHQPFGYFGCLLLMAALSMLIVLFLRVRKWI